ncbi:MAG: hypothetical protein K5668_02620 [Lachnospiraceae bacterium]|nr:hypothetical protein [Lachnospiraceae bacterium]
MRSKISILILAAVTVLTACGGEKKNDQGEVLPKIDEESTEESVGEKPEVIERDEALKALEEKLEGTGCRAVFSKKAEVDEVDCYLYSVVNNDGEEPEQMLAVNAVSGEVMVYDSESESLLPFDRFEYYKDDGKGPVSWDSVYYLAPFKVSLMPADDTSFEFSITKDGSKKAELTGVADVSSDSPKEAFYEDGNLSLTFVNNGETLEIRDKGKKSGFAGKYERVE